MHEVENRPDGQCGKIIKDFANWLMTKQLQNKAKAMGNTNTSSAKIAVGTLFSTPMFSNRKTRPYSIT